MTDDQYKEILSRLERIENLLKPLEEDTSYSKKIMASLLGNFIWEWIQFGSPGLHPPK